MSILGRPRIPDNQVLAEETRGDEWQSRQRTPGDQKRPEGYRQFFAQTAHAEDTVLVIESVNNDARTQKEQGFEKRVGYEVEHGGLPCAHTKRQEHVANLTDRRVGKDALDVMLGKRAEAGE